MISNTLFSVKYSNFVRVKHGLSITVIIALTYLLGACQITSPPPPMKVEKKIVQPISYSQYYLWLKSLNKKQVLAEKNNQKLLLNNPLDDKTNNDRINTQGKLVLIYSLPNPEFHNPYKAKQLLNELLLSSNKISKNNLAFTMLLRDQLNAQLYLIQKQEKLTKNFNNSNNKNDIHIKELNQQLKHVNQQLLLLIQIDQNINERG